MGASLTPVSNKPGVFVIGASPEPSAADRQIAAATGLSAEAAQAFFDAAEGRPPPSPTRQIVLEDWCEESLYDSRQISRPPAGRGGRRRR